MFTRILLSIRLYIIIIFSPFDGYGCMGQFLQNIVTPDMDMPVFKFWFFHWNWVKHQLHWNYGVSF